MPESGRGRGMDDGGPSAAPAGCPLCGAPVRPYATDPRRAYVRCSVCELIAVPEFRHPTPDAERRRYDLHRNSPSDAGYVRFLMQLVDAMAPKLRQGAEGLDFGSGPSPVLAGIMEGRGFRVRTYDPFYANDRTALGRTYDFVICSEVVEHFRRPADDWHLLVSLVAPGASLGVMTSLWEGSPGEFVRWHYANDVTHLAFYNRTTMAWIARRYGMEVTSAGGQVTLFNRNCSASL
jgi:hypothetical protein